MKHSFKQPLACLLVLSMTLALLGTSAWGAEAQMNYDTATYIDPIYQAVIDESNLLPPQPFAVQNTESIPTFDNVVDARAYVLSKFVAHEPVIQVHFPFNYSGLMNDVGDLDKMHTGNPKEGDYLQFQMAWRASASSDGRDTTLTYTPTYWTTKTQEAELDTAVAKVHRELALDGKSSYEKVKAIYDYVCTHTTYDYTHLNDDSYMLKLTAYAALVNGTAVCQGYSVLMYRLLLEEGIDCRVVTGVQRPLNCGHAWNIVRLGDCYYNIDATWDSSSGKHTYFLRSDAFFSEDHIKSEEYASGDFAERYPMASSSYDPSQQSEDVPLQPQEDRKYYAYLSRNSYTYDGLPKTPTAVVFQGKTPLTLGKDYTVTYQDNTKPGTAIATIIITRTGEQIICTFTIEEGTSIVSGTCGKKLNWSVMDNGILLIHGTGNMDNYNLTSVSGLAPWYNYRTCFDRIVIEDGVTSVGDAAFYGCYGIVSSVIIPPSVTSISMDMFPDITVYGYRNTAAERFAKEYEVPFQPMDETTPATPVKTIVPGDVNDDGDVTIADVVKVNRYVLGKIQLTADELTAADVTGDGDITIADVVKINRYVIGKITSL